MLRKDIVRYFALASISGVIFFASWTGVFAVGRWGFPPNIFAGLCFTYAVAKFPFSSRNNIFHWQDLSFAIFLALACISAAMQPNSKSINYLISYGYVYVGLQFLLRFAIYTQKYFLRLFLGVNVVACLFVSIFCVFEFMSRYYIGYNLQALLPRVGLAQATMASFPRVYGFSEEPTYLSWYLNTLGSLAIWHMWQGEKRNIALPTIGTSIVLVAYLATFSLAGFASAVFGTIIVICAILLRGRANLSHVPWKPALLAGFSIMVCVGLLTFALTRLPVYIFDHARSAVLELASSLDASAPSQTVYLSPPMATYTDETGSVMDRLVAKSTGTGGDARQDRWTAHLAMVLQKPLMGYGPGYLSAQGQESSNNLFLFIAVEVGLPASIAIAVGLLIVGASMFKNRSPGSIAYLFAFTSGVAHLVTQSQMFHVNIWLVIALYFASQNLGNRRPGCDSPAGASN